MSNNKTDPPLIVDGNTYSKKSSPAAIEPLQHLQEAHQQLPQIVSSYQPHYHQHASLQTVTSQQESNLFAVSNAPLSPGVCNGHQIGYSGPNLQTACSPYPQQCQIMPPYYPPNQPLPPTGFPSHSLSHSAAHTLPAAHLHPEIPLPSPGLAFPYVNSPVSPHSSGQHQYFDYPHGSGQLPPRPGVASHQYQEYCSSVSRSSLQTDQYTGYPTGASNRLQNHSQTQQHYSYPQAPMGPGLSFGIQSRRPSNDATGYSRNKSTISARSGSRIPRPRLPQARHGSSATTSTTVSSIESGDPSDTKSKFVLGPPRKPRQSGYALWIGNLPTKTDLMDLVRHVCSLTDGLESLFLIAKSNCAFANFEDEPSWNNALQKIHEAEFNNTHLVARHRRTSTGAPLVTSLEADATGNLFISTGDLGTSKTDEPSSASTQLSSVAGDTAMSGNRNRAKSRFFVLKSLTADDLELSVRTGIWATQPHNEDVLNEAFEYADNVYLIFSANKSGEYFGYARMSSPLNNDPDAAIAFGSLSTQLANVGVPTAVLVPSNDKVPDGRIISDTIRGTTFWEIQRQDGKDSINDQADSSISVHDSMDETKAFGKPFKLDWLSTAKVPFHHTKGILNAWNGNRDVKIARDGTEIEPSAGFKLLALFERVGASCPGVTDKAEQTITTTTS
ncbi:hypothetical protein BROUX41_002039 [Berkeleyomyces rouxiae]|uniref:uncharacterized protein n=1 Tax=Berkeleyomyces rouxiae TaxID=2035830 RepID=UPI003B7F7681